jgi:membrane-associated phospholipid phosphatase
MDLPQERPPVAGWFQQAWIRGLTHWPAKTVGMTLGMTLFFIAYFCVLRHPLFPVTTMPITGIDRLISFRPEVVPLYLSLWFYVSLVPALLVERRELVSYALAATGISVIGLGIFLLWPTTVNWSDTDWSQYPAFAFLQSVDASGNVCPSLHVAFAVFTAIWLDRLLRQMGAGYGACAFNWLWCLGILYSTIAVRQHVILDVLAGAGLGVFVALVQLRGLVKRI